MRHFIIAATCDLMMSLGPRHAGRVSAACTLPGSTRLASGWGNPCTLFTRVRSVAWGRHLALFTSPCVGQQRNRRNLRNDHPVQAVCEFVRIKSSRACASARSCRRSVRRMRVNLAPRSKSSSLRGWR